MESTIQKYLLYYHEGTDINLVIECSYQGWWFWNQAKQCHERVTLRNMLDMGFTTKEMHDTVKSCQRYFISNYGMFYELIDRISYDK